MTKIGKLLVMAVALMLLTSFAIPASAHGTDTNIALGKPYTITAPITDALFGGVYET